MVLINQGVVFWHAFGVLMLCLACYPGVSSLTPQPPGYFLSAFQAEERPLLALNVFRPDVFPHDPPRKVEVTPARLT